jgi:hypothetical protein
VVAAGISQAAPPAAPQACIASNLFMPTSSGLAHKKTGKTGKNHLMILIYAGNGLVTNDGFSFD